MLTHKDCTPCQGGALPYTLDVATSLLQETPGWALAHGGTAIFRKYVFKDFDQAFDLAKKIAAIAQEQNHHPDISFGWGYVKVRLMTHAINGLHENDFILAAKINGL